MCWKCGVRWRMTIASGMPIRSSVALLEGDHVDIARSPAARCRSRSTSAEEVYSTVAKPWLKVRAASTFSSSASGIGSPVSAWSAKRRSTSGRSSQCSKSCDGSSTKSRATLVPEIERIGHVGEEAVQRVAELVEQRARVVEAERSAGSPAGGLAKFITLTTIGRTSPLSFCWSRSALIQAPLRFDGRAK